LFHKGTLTEGKIFRLWGMFVDNIEKLEPPACESQTTSGAYPGSLEGFAHLMCHEYGNSEKLKDAIHRLPFFDVESGLFRDNCLGRHNRTLGTGEAHSYFHQMREQAKPLVNRSVMSLFTLLLFYQASIGSFFLRRGADLGLARLISRPGDLVCVFQGCDVPVIVRSVSGDTARTSGW